MTCDRRNGLASSYLAIFQCSSGGNAGGHLCKLVLVVHA